MDAISVLLLDECALLRNGCRGALEHAGYLVTAEAGTMAGALSAYAAHHPKLVLMELSPSMGGIGLIRQLLSIDQRARILVFSVHDGAAIVERALQAGACGYVAKNAGLDDFLEGVRKTSRGERYLSEELALSFALSSLSDRGGLLEELTQREFEIFQLLVWGERISAISATLGLAPRTVTNSCMRIKRKLRVKSMSGLVRLAIDTGVLKRNVADPGAGQKAQSATTSQAVDGAAMLAGRAEFPRAFI